VTGPTPSSRRGRHASPEPGGAGRGTAWPGPHAGPADESSTGPLPSPGERGGLPRPGSSAHPSAPLPDLPPRPAGAWSRLQRRPGADDDATVAQPIGMAPAVPGDPYGEEHPPDDPHGDEERDSTGGLEVLGAGDGGRRGWRRRREARSEGLLDDHLDDPHHDLHDDDLHDDDLHDDDLHVGYGPEDHEYEDLHDEAPRGRRRARRPAAVLLSLLVLAGLVAGIFFGGSALINLVNPPSEDFAGSGSGDVQTRIAVGDTLSDIARTLVDDGVIASVGPFIEAAEVEPAATGIQPGVYAMRQQMSGQAALDLLLDPATRLFARVTIPEGFTVQAVLERLAEATQVPIEELQAAAADPAALGLPPYAGGQLEGFLFPATYDFEPDDTAVDMLRAMVEQFATTAQSIQLEQRAAAAGRSALDVVTVASMVQSETRLDEERADVAQVVYNRLAQGIPLGIDATLAYGLQKNGNELTVDDLQTDSPYNTRTRTGLPPTPISSPGEASLEAALAPSTGGLLYYVLESEDGRHFFTASYDEFLEARARCAAAGLGCGG
jgi:UPF0755 protein